MIHENSKQALYEERKSLSDRASKIYEYVRGQSSNSFTDRQIMTNLGFTEPNQVRPRITELVERGLLYESGSAKCDVTDKTVRLVKIVSDVNKQQMEMF